MVVCDRWIAIKTLEVIFCISCLVAKRVTDDESVRVSLYLQKISREWSFLRNITWSSVGSSFADAVYGGYLLITFGLLLGWLFNEVPKGKRILEGFLLGIGALFFVILGALELASLDSIPDRLIDNAAVLGVLSLVTAVLFLIDLAGRREKKTSPYIQTNEDRRFKYPTLPREQPEVVVTEAENPKKVLKGDKFVSDKDKKNAKKEAVAKIEPEKKENIQSKNTETDEPDHGTSSHGYQKFDQSQNDGDTLERMEKTKYGSVRNGIIKIPRETESSQTKSPNYDHYKVHPKDLDVNSVYEIEMDKNIAYLRRVEDNKYQQQGRNSTRHNIDELKEAYMNDFKEKMTLPLQSNRVYMREPSPGYDKQRHWETFERETLPSYPVREDYLPELQTPVFAKVKETKNKGYGVYDSYSNYGVVNKKTEGSQTDTLEKKNTLKSKAPTLQQIAEYFGLERKHGNRIEKRETASQVYKDDVPAVSFVLPNRARTDGLDHNGEPTSPTDPGYVQYTAQHWNEKHNYKHSRTPRHSPSDG